METIYGDLVNLIKTVFNSDTRIPTEQWAYSVCKRFDSEAEQNLFFTSV